MAILLQRLGRFAFRRAWLVIGVWLVVLAGILGGGAALGGQTQESFAIPGTESQDTIDKLAEVFPAAGGAQVQAVYRAPDGASVSDPRYKDAIEEMATALQKVPGVESAITPFSPYASDAVSDDSSTAFTQVQLTGASTDVTPETLKAVTATASIGEAAGLTVAFGGQVFQDNTFGITITEVFGVVFAGVVLIITFGSLLAAGMPLLMALIGVGVAIGGVTAVSAFATVSSTAPMLALMLGLAVGIDYSLFILSRHRLQLARGMDAEESAAISVATAGGAVVFAGLTVIIALLGLLVVGIPFLSVMGVAAAFAVLVAMLVALTLLPAVLGLLGSRLAPRPGSRTFRRAVAGDAGSPTLGRRWVGLVLRAPAVAVVAVVAVLAVLAVPALSLDLNLPDGASEPAGSTQRQAFEMIEDGFGPGYNGPLIVAVDITQTTDIVADLAGIRTELQQLPDVAYVGKGLPNETVDTAIIQVMPESAPNAAETKQLVQSIRDLAPGIEAEFGTPIAVTGATAVSIDISNRLSNALIPFALIVVGLSIILLMMVFRSVFVPVKAAVGFLLSVFASLGATVAIFQWGWFADALGVEPGPILSFLPILLMAVLFGLAMDYEVFLVSGMREEFVKTGRPRQAITGGFTHAARVVTAAALIMFFVFFAFVPEGSDVIKGIAFALAVGVFLDAFLVRMTLVPGAMALAGRAAWWLPPFLARVLPNVDIEGEGLRDHLAAREWAGEQGLAITADALVAGSPAHPIGPIDVRVPRGGLVFLTGPVAERRALAATLSGRLDPVSGRLQVHGIPLPSERSRALGAVALCQVAGVHEEVQSATVADVIAERLALTLPWFRSRVRAGQIDEWVRRVRHALETATKEHPALTAATPIASLAPLERAAVRAAAALAEKPAVVVVDLGEERAERRVAGVLGALAPTTTTIVLSAAAVASTAKSSTGSRDLRRILLGAAPLTDPDPIDRKAVL
ncbi:MMPL family transporter [Cryobacterium tepidiphilum]|uniref:MMPL family transporter n=1 Tax=Cryobacterium tepidiphilum TaxID=2486026 RepID=A0A3M8L3R5_9MICO|nr:MMPL family transporter [Cryobacterium tepidiphilum]RNE59294.1 MMPL family transporter [Cryobacterium tepidiphilum]